MSQPVASPRTNPTGRTSPPGQPTMTVILRHRLPPFLRKLFGGGTGLVEVEVVLGASDPPVPPGRNEPVASFEDAAAPVGPGALDHHGEGHAASDRVGLLDGGLEVVKRAGVLFHDLA